MSNIYQFPSENQLPLAEHRFTVTIFPDHLARVQSRKIMTLDGLADLILNETGLKKKRLPWLKLAVFGNKASPKGCLRHTGNMLELTGIEIEHDTGAMSFDEVVERLAAADLRALVYTSPSYIEGEKEKWRVLAPLSASTGVDVRARLVARINGVVGGVAAPESFTLPQAYYYGRVGDNPGHSVTVLDGDFIDLRDDLDIGAIGKPIAPRKERVNDPAASGEAWGRSEEEIRALLEKSRQQGHWHNSMLFAIASMVGKRWEDSRIYDACRPYCPLGMDEIEGMLVSAREKWRVSNPGKDWSTALGDPLKQVAAASGKELPIVMPRWREIYQGGNPKASLHNARLAIEALKIHCSTDTFHNRLWIGRSEAASPREMLLPFFGLVSDTGIGALRVYLSKVFGLDFTEKHVRDAVSTLCDENRFNPVLDMLAEAEANWDGVPRLDRMAADYFNCEDTELNRQCVRKTMIAAVARARAPGIKFDTMLVMESEEGWNKSTAWAVLAGEGNFSDETILGKASREVQEALAGVWIHENAELAGMRKAEVETIKTFASRQVDRARPAYGRFLVEQPRHSIEVGTTNSRDYLLSPTGNRRLWPIRVLRPIDVGKLRAARLQLWGEAAACQSKGECLTLDEILWAPAKAEQEARRVRHLWEDVLAERLARTAVGSLVFRVGDELRVTTEILLSHFLQVPISDYQRHSRALADVMRQLGWENCLIKQGGMVSRGYRRKVTPVTAE